MVELARHQHPDVRVTFHTDIAPSDLILYADENLVSQVVINLLKMPYKPSNRIKIQIKKDISTYVPTATKRKPY